MLSDGNSSPGHGAVGSPTDRDAFEALRITVVYSEPPVPTNHGGRAEVWGRLQGLKMLGVKVQLICWADTPPDEADLVRMNEVCDDVLVLSPRPVFAALVEWQYPPRTRRLRPARADRSNIIERVRLFAPRFVLLDNWPSFPFARDLCTALGLPLVYRSQNVEVDYWNGMVSTASRAQRLRLSVNARRVRRLERELRSFARVVLDISEEDRVRSALLGQEGQSFVLPGTRLPKLLPCVPWHARDIDVLFAGNLWAPNNVNGLMWFCEAIMPPLRALKPEIRVVVAGGRPTAAVRSAAARVGLECIPDPDDMDAVRARARVLINPQLQYGGLMQKMLDYLAHDSWVVSTRSGAAGLTGALPLSLVVRDGAEEFAREIADLCDNDAVPENVGAEYLEREFGLHRLRQSVDRIVAAIARRGDR